MLVQRQPTCLHCWPRLGSVCELADVRRCWIEIDLTVLA